MEQEHLAFASLVAHATGAMTGAGPIRRSPETARRNLHNQCPQQQIGVTDVRREQIHV